MSVQPAPSRRKVQRFEDLQVWQTARELVMGVYRACKSQSLNRDFVLADQMKRAAVSICSNIAEGFERGTRKQNIEFCYIAKGSAGELRCQIVLAHDCGLIETHARDWLFERCEHCSRLIAGYIKHLKATQKTVSGMKFVDELTEIPIPAQRARKASQ